MCFLFFSCATLQMQRVPISFNEIDTMAIPEEIPFSEYNRLNINKDKEILLNFKKPEKELNYYENSLFFSQINENSGIKSTFSRYIKMLLKGDSQEFWEILMESEIKSRENKKLIMKFIMSKFGEIQKFLYGKGNILEGKVEILDWKREAIFPKKPVKVGDRWKYSEKMTIKISYFFIDSTSPEEIHVFSKFDGYARYKGQLCAIITSKTHSQRKESFSTIFKKFNIIIDTYASEKTLFDIEKGIIVAKIADIHSFTFSEDGAFSDESRGKVIQVICDKNRNPN